VTGDATVEMAAVPGNRHNVGVSGGAAMSGPTRSSGLAQRRRGPWWRLHGSGARTAAVILVTVVVAAGCVPAVPNPPLSTGPLGGTEPAQRVLVFSRTTGFRHDSIPTGIDVLRRELPAWGIGVDATEDPSVFTDAGLAGYGAVVFLNTTGDVLDDAQQGAFERYIRGGGSYVGVHAASDTEYEWPFYGELVGAWFTRHPLPFGMRIRVEDRDELATALLPRTFGLFEEIYDFDRNPRGDPATQVLMTVADSYSLCDAVGGAVVGPGCELTRVPSDFAMGADHPVAWQKEFQGGRSFYTNLGHMISTWDRPEFLHHLIGGIRWAVGEDRRDQTIVVDDQLDAPVRLTVAPDGDVWVVQKGGEVVVIDPTTGRRRIAARIPVNTFGEQGLLGIAIDPDTDTDTPSTVYLYGVEGVEAPTGILARYPVRGDGTLDVAARTELVRIPVDGGTHHGGAVEIDAAGHLLLSVGDTTNPFESSGYSPIDRRPGREGFNALRSSGNPDDLRGKVLRIRRDGSVPPGNLFPDGVGGDPRIFAMGLRNPFSLAVGADGRAFVGDVGPDAFFDGNPGPRGEDEINQLQAGDYGWPRCIGDRRAYRDRDFASDTVGPAFDCSATVRPALSYDYLTVSQWALADGGRTAIAGDVIDPADTTGPFAQPAHLAGTLLMSEWSRSRVLAVRFGADGRATSVERLFPHLRLRALDLDIAPDGAIYAIEYGATGRLVRVEHVDDARHRPRVTVTADRTSGPSPLRVRLTADATTIAPGDAVERVEWDLDDDGAFDDAVGDAAEVVLEGSGTRTVRAVARSRDGRTSLPASVQVTLGNTPPTVRVTQDPPGAVATGQVVTYRAEVVDAEDGSSATDPTLCDRVTWRSSITHNNHQHPDEPQVGGCTFVSTVTLDDQHAPGASVGWAVAATYVDRGANGSGGGTDLLSATGEVRAPYASGPGGPLAGLPREVRSFIELLAQQPPIDDLIRGLDWHHLLVNGYEGYLG